MTQPAEILIASSSYDRPVFEPVEQELTRRGFNCIVYEADKVVSGKHPLTIAITDEHGLSIRYNGRPYEPQAMAAAWYRRPSDFGPEIDDKARMLGIVAENKSLQHGTFDFVETEDGRIVFLELNPNGQYMWLEQQLGLPISQAIASKLASVALDHAGYA